jgi:hypothetical protein
MNGLTDLTVSHKVTSTSSSKGKEKSFTNLLVTKVFVVYLRRVSTVQAVWGQVIKYGEV